VVYRDEDVLSRVGSKASSFVDRTASPGTHHSYSVVAHRGRDYSPPSQTVTVHVPVPPLTAARLEGTYHVNLTVRRAKNVASLAGIEQPVRGKEGTDAWNFASTCEPGLSACATTWQDNVGKIRPRGTSWRGVSRGPDAHCFADTQVHAPVRFRLNARDARVADGAWVVDRFTGTMKVSFHCPGFPPSAGTVWVIGHRRRAPPP
jgi:hypothetical protein